MEIISTQTVLDFQFLDEQEFSATYQVENGQDQCHMKFRVKGMSCSKCVQKIESLAERIEGVSGLRASLSSELVEVSLKKNQRSFGEIARAIQGLGFEVTPIPVSSNQLAIQKMAFREELTRIGVAGFCGTNIMMFAIANYAGASAEFEKLFNWLQFGLYLPVLTYVALPFYRGAYRSLKQKSLSIDFPMAVASVAGFIFSAVNLLRGEGSIYFDSLAGFLFMILISRFFQRRLQNSSLDVDLGASLETISKAKLWDGHKWKWVPTKNLKAGNTVYLQRGDSVPVDGRVSSRSAVVDTSFLTGESHPRRLHHGMKVFAGAVVLSAEALVNVEVVGAETEFGRILSSLREDSLKSTKTQNLSDFWSQTLLKVVFAIAILFLVIYWRVSPKEALERSLALIILACPCAMAFGTPLALAFSMKSAARKGFLLKSADIFSKVHGLRNVFLDKTGTLTHRKMKVKETLPPKVDLELATIVLGLEMESYHPVAEGLREFLTSKFPLEQMDFKALSGVREVAGKGVQGIYEGKFYELRNSDKITGQKSVGLFCEGLDVAHFIFEDPLMPGARELVEKFRSMGMEIFLLSGDARGFVTKVGDELGVEKTNVFCEKTPQEKAFIVSQHPGSLMIGDGVNDTPAFLAASLGIAVKGSVELALRSSDVYFLSNDLKNLPEIIFVANRANSLIKRNLFISLAYNLLAGTSALLGFVNPLVAAVLMPISSGFILTHTWWSTRK